MGFYSPLRSTSPTSSPLSPFSTTPSTNSSEKTLAFCYSSCSYPLSVLMDVVFNHTTEGNENGPILSFGGVDNSVFYMLTPKVVFYCHFPDMLLAQHTTLLRRIYRKPIDFIEEMTIGMADLILVNSKFTASTFANTFKHLDARGIKPAVLYPAVNLDQFAEPNASKLNFLSISHFEWKKNIDLAISAFAMLHTLEGGDVLQGHNLADACLIVADIG